MEADEYLAHHGVLGQKWGVRRYQNEDSTRTPLGKKHEAMLEKKHGLNIDKKVLKKVAIGAGIALAGAAVVGGVKLATSGTLDLDRVSDVVYRVAKKADKTPAKEVINKKPSDEVMKIINANKMAKTYMNDAQKSMIPKTSKLRSNKSLSKAFDKLDSVSKNTAIKRGQQAYRDALGIPKTTRGKISKGARKALSNYRAKKLYEKAMNKSIAEASNGLSRSDVRRYIDQTDRIIKLMRE